MDTMNWDDWLTYAGAAFAMLWALGVSARLFRYSAEKFLAHGRTPYALGMLIADVTIIALGTFSILGGILYWSFIA